MSGRHTALLYLVQEESASLADKRAAQAEVRALPEDAAELSDEVPLSPRHNPLPLHLP